MSIINNPSVVINNNPVPVVANSVTFNEGLGEGEFKVESTGGGNVGLVFCENIESKIGEVKFEMLPKIQNIDAARGWKLLKSANTIEISGKDSTTGKSITRTFTKAAIMSNYEVGLSTDGKLSLEWKSKPAV